MNAVCAFDQMAQRNPDHPAIITESGPCSYRRLAERSAHIADAWRQRGLARGDRVAILLPNSVDLVALYLGTQRAGGIPVVINPLLKPPELQFILQDSRPRVLVTLHEHVTRVPAEALTHVEHLITTDASPIATPLDAFLKARDSAAAPDDVGDRDGAVLVYSSATTGVPKGVLLSHGNITFNSRSKRRYLGIRPADRLLLFVPLSHCFGQNAIMNAAFFSGATIVLHHRFDAEAILRSVERDRVTMFFAVPTVYARLLDRVSPEAFASVRYFFSAADTLPPDVASRWQEAFSLPIHEGYGLTETSPFACYNHERSHRVGSIGTPIDGVDMRIADPDTGADVPAGAVGEILVRGPNVMLGYWQRDDDTARAFRDGWFRTGDLGRVDADGYFYIVDRLKDMIVVGGLKVFPAEVERALAEHPDVAEVVAFGLPDPLSRERVGAHVVARPGTRPTTEMLRAHCRARLADYKVPVDVRVVESLPRTASGKVLRRELRAMAAIAARDRTFP